MKTQASNFRTSHGPLQAHVDRKPRELIREEPLRALVEPLALGAEEELASPDQHVVQPRIPIKGEVQRPRSLRRRFARRQRIQEEMGIASGDRGLRDRDVVRSGLQECPHGRFGLHLDVQRQLVRAQEELDRLGELWQVERRRLGRHEQRGFRILRPAALADERLHRGAAPTKNRRALPSRPDARRQERLERDGRPVQGHAEDGWIEGRCNGFAERLARERLLLGLEREISDAKARGRERPFGAPRGACGEPDVERP